MTWTAIIVDDEPPARKRLSDLLRDEKDILVLNQCEDAAQAIENIRERNPDILFLDIQMPGLSGFGILEALPEDYQPAIVFVTAFARHAVQAFGVDAVDYLLKPYTKERFRQALTKAKQFLQVRQFAPAKSSASPLPQRLIVKSPQRIVFLRPAEIDWIEAAGNYLLLHVGKTTHCVRGTLASMERQLVAERFARVSRFALVNMDRVKELLPASSGQHIVILADNQRLAMTRPLSDLQAHLGRSP